MRARYWLLCAVVVGCGLATEVWGQQPISWQPNIDIAKRIAAQTNRLVLIHFWSPSCGPCQKMEHEVFPRPEVAAAIEAAYVPVKLNADFFPATARQFGVSNLPTDVVITPQGQIVQQNVGALPVSKYADMLNQVAAHVRRDAAASYAQIQAGAAPGYGQMPAASIPGSPAPAAPSLPASAFPSNPYLAQGGNLDARTANAPVQPPYGVQGPPNSAPPETANPAPGAGAGQLGGSFGGGAMLPQYAGLPSSNNPAGAPQPSPTPQGPSRSATAEAMPPNPGWAPFNNPGMAQPGANPGPASSQPSVQPPSGWQVASVQPTVNPAAPPSGADAAAAAPPASGNPPLALDGYCPVQLAEKERWVKGNPRWGVIHRGRTYLFAGPEEQKRFYADPDRFSPVLSGVDIVMAVEQQQTVAGRREHGVWFEGRVYLFATEDSLRRFDADPYRYAKAIAGRTAPTAMEANNGMAVGAGSGRY